MSLRHRFWLEALLSPLVHGGGEITILDLELAAQVCSTPFEQLEAKMRKPLGRWAKVRRWIRGFCHVFRDLNKANEAWVSYVEDHCSCVPVHRDETEASQAGSDVWREEFPASFDLVSGLIRHTTWDPDKIWSLEPGEADWYLMGLLRHRGADASDLKIKTSHDEEFEAGLAEEQAMAAARKMFEDDQLAQEQAKREGLEEILIRCVIRRKKRRGSLKGKGVSRWKKTKDGRGFFLHCPKRGRAKVRTAKEKRGRFRSASRGYRGKRLAKR